MNIYVASSWRNVWQPAIVEFLRIDGHDVYDFRNPEPDVGGFQWSEIDADWQRWTPSEYREALQHPIARDGFTRDMDALRRCDVCVLVQPCGRSAHLELGWAVGAGKRTVVLLENGEPELMVAMVDVICTGPAELLTAIRRFDAELSQEVGAS